MNTVQKIAVAIPGVSLGLTAFIYLSCAGTRLLHIADLRQLLFFIPPWIQVWVGTMNVAVFFPVFILGIYSLKPRSAVGDAQELVTSGVYRYLCNPLYAGVSFTVFGLGFILGHTGVVLAGLAWLMLCYVQSRREEKVLIARFGQSYMTYRQHTPRFVPKFNILFQDMWRIVRHGM
ncbi:MAG: isoprenylcysteine carboxylmethyltransferase family protein [Pontiellaceae bacterium]|nr:isoprenylcysteine carboxylmethyltransferase family protein [Pontiellaceae bacterium]